MVVVYYKFKNAVGHKKIPLDGSSISVATLKRKILESMHLNRDIDFELVVTNSKTHEEYLDETELIPEYTTLIVDRVPGEPRLPIFTELQEIPKVEIEPEEGGIQNVDVSSMKYAEIMPEEKATRTANDELITIKVVQRKLALTDAEKEDEKEKIHTPTKGALQSMDYGLGQSGVQYCTAPLSPPPRQVSNGYHRGSGRDMGGRDLGGQQKTPHSGYVCLRCKMPGHLMKHCPTKGDINVLHSGYVCHRCKMPGHLIKHCPTNGDPSYDDFKRVKSNEAAFEKEKEGLPTTRTVKNIPSKPTCPICKNLVKGAAITKNCCSQTFCEKCIDDHIITHWTCFCGENFLRDC